MNIPRKDRVLFLDIDGVLNIPQDRMHPDPDRCLTPALLSRLDLFIQETNCSVVISSSWRYRHTLDSLREIFAKYGFTFTNSIVDFTPDLASKAWNSVPRGLEIDNWLKEHPEVTHYAILDDTDDMLHLTDHLILVDDGMGLSDGDLREIKFLWMAYS
jgi:hypothetical protein